LSPPEPSAWESDRVSLSEPMHRSLQPVALGLILLYAFYASVGHLALTAPVWAVLFPVRLATVMIISAVYFLLRTGKVGIRWAYHVTLLLIGLALINSTVHFVYTPDPEQTTNFLLLVVGCGVSVLSPIWFVVSAGTTLAAWGTVAYTLGTPGNWATSALPF